MIDCKCDTLKVVSDTMFEEEDKFLCDFDDLKKKFCKNKKIESLTSCDGLFYKNKKIYFIEFKDLEKIISGNLSAKNVKKSLKKFIKKNFENNNLLKKIDESKHILDDYLYRAQQRKLKFELDYFYYIVISFPDVPSKNIYLELKMLSVKPTMININEIKKKLKKEIDYLNDKVYFLKECKYIKKEEFLKKQLFWKSKECKGE